MDRHEFFHMVKNSDFFHMFLYGVARNEWEKNICPSWDHGMFATHMFVGAHGGPSKMTSSIHSVNTVQTVLLSRLLGRVEI